jgi:tetratricopeptide (TPR) repeat protein
VLHYAWLDRYALEKHSRILGPFVFCKQNEVLQIRLQETNIAIAYEQQGYFEQAQGAYELAMTKFRNDYNGQASPIGVQQVSRRHGRKTPTLSVQGTLAGELPGRETEKDMQADAIRETDRKICRQICYQRDRRTDRKQTDIQKYLQIGKKEKGRYIQPRKEEERKKEGGTQNPTLKVLILEPGNTKGEVSLYL